MQSELILKDHRGTVRILVNLFTFNYGMKDINGNEFRYDIHVWYKPKGKRTEISNFTIATDAEIYAAKMELWQKLKP